MQLLRSSRTLSYIIIELSIKRPTALSKNTSDRQTLYAIYGVARVTDFPCLCRSQLQFL